MAYLPYELIAKIVDLLRDDSASLCASALACRTLAIASRRHLFHVVNIHSVERATRLDFLVASSKDLPSLIHTITLVGHWEKPPASGSAPSPPLVNVPRIGELLSSLPRLESVRILALCKFLWPLEAAYELLSAKFPSVTELRLRNVRCQTFRGLTSIISAFSSLDVLVADQVAFTSGYESPDPPPDLAPPPPTLHTLELRLRRYRPNSIPWKSARVLARWLSTHPAPERIHTLTYTGGEYDPGPPLVQLLCAWGPAALQHLELEITEHKGMCPSRA